MGAKRKLFGNGDLQDVCVCGGYLLLGRASVRISRAVFIVKSIVIINENSQEPMEKKRVRQHRKLFSLFVFLPI